MNNPRLFSVKYSGGHVPTTVVIHELQKSLNSKDLDGILKINPPCFQHGIIALNFELILRGVFNNKKGIINEIPSRFSMVIDKKSGVITYHHSS